MEAAQVSFYQAQPLKAQVKVTELRNGTTLHSFNKQHCFKSFPIVHCASAQVAGSECKVQIIQVWAEHSTTSP